MLDAHADRVLRALGREPAPQGIFLPEQVRAALAAFERHLASDAAPDLVPEAALEPGDEDAPDVARRAWPVLKMLERAECIGKPVVWSCD